MVVMLENSQGVRKVAPSNFADLAPVFTTSELARLAEYLLVALTTVQQAASAAENRRASDKLVARLDASAADLADLRSRILSLVLPVDR